MPHPRVQSHRNSYQARANGVRSQLGQAERQELARQDLTAAQRRRNIGHLRRQAERHLADLRREYEQGKPDLLRAIAAPLHRLPPQVSADISWRDAMDRASAVQSQDDAVTLFERAHLAGDVIQMTALAYVACPTPWEDRPPRWAAVIAAWRRTDPKVRDTLADFDQAYQELTEGQHDDAALFTMPAEQQPDDHDRLPTLQPVPDQPSA